MGFFSSRKSDEDHVASNADRSVVHVIRSRFYGKNKGKEREEPQATFRGQVASTAQTLSQPVAVAPATTPSVKNNTPSPSFITLNGKKTETTSHSTRSNPNERSLPPIPSSSKPTKSRVPDKSMPPPPSPLGRPRKTSGSKSNRDPNIVAPTPRKPTDTVTVTLAQRLNELAVANSEGLLNDDEYRMLRQNLFERFASSAVVPTEASVVPVARHQARRNGTASENRGSMRMSSNFVVEPRTPSLRSSNSISSGMTSLFRRATGHKQPGSNDFSETSSIFSSTSNTSNMFRLPRVLSKKSSNSSVKSSMSRQADTVSISSRRTGLGSDRSPAENASPSFSPAISRTNAASIRRFATPPSSFPSRGVSDTKLAGNVQNVFDEENLQTSQQIKQEMAAVEAEGKRLMDAFNGLELSTLTKRQHRQRVPVVSAEEAGEGSTWTLIPDNKAYRRPYGVDSDMASIRSATSNGTAPSMAKSGYSSRNVVRSKASSSLMYSSRPGSLHRKNSGSSLSSAKRDGSKATALAPPVPALPSAMTTMTLGHMGSTSSVNLARSIGHAPMQSVAEDEGKSLHGTLRTDEDHEVETEMDDIRRRREEVSKRYEARLEYLRAKLKGAQLHEKLVKK